MDKTQERFFAEHHMKKYEGMGGNRSTHGRAEKGGEVGMTELEKVLNGIEEVRKSGIQCPLENVEPRRCSHFPEKLIDDIVSLLKAQEPRVMMLTEAFDAEVAWLERYANPDDGVEPIIQPVIIRYYENGYWQCLIEQDESADLSLFLDGFGTEFRFWTSKPTDEQREAVKWE